jgi:hypothetical protein
MRLVKPTVWTTRRKWLGNLIPALFYLPPLAYGIFWMTQKDEILGVGLVYVAVSPVLAWIALNFFGLFENSRMRRELTRELRARESGLPDDALFVGFATPKYHGVLDAHEDVGFLIFGDSELEFRGERRSVQVPRREIALVRFRPNVHTLVGLGRWISVEGVSKGQPFRLLVEPRVRATMLGNLRQGKALKSRIEVWIKGTGPGPKSGAA